MKLKLGKKKRKKNQPKALSANSFIKYQGLGNMPCGSD